MIQFTLKGKMLTKKNMYRRSRNGGMFKPDEVTAWEKDMYYQMKQARLPKTAGYYSITMQIYFKTAAGDLDGAITSLLDVFQIYGLIDNDAHVVEQHSFKLKDKKNPRAVIELVLLDK